MGLSRRKIAWTSLGFFLGFAGAFCVVLVASRVATYAGLLPLDQQEEKVRVVMYGVIGFCAVCSVVGASVGYRRGVR